MEFSQSPLFKGHQCARKALKLSKQGHYEKAAHFHLEAAKFFHEISLKETTASKSLEEQSKYHQRQAQLADKLREAVTKQREAKAKRAEERKLFDKPLILPALARLKQQPMAVSEIRRNFDEADSLLTLLQERQAPGVELKDVQNIKQPIINDFCIRPKNDKDVIEELKTVNTNLRTLVDKLLNELKLMQDENKVLEKKLETYESKEKASGKLQSQPSSSSSSSQNLMMQLDAASSKVHLPDLAPLENPPTFDFSQK